MLFRIVAVAMQSVCSSRLRQAALAATLLVVAFGPRPVEALDLFARHQVTVQFATSDGKPMANAEVRVFAPGEPNRPALTGRTDNEGKFEFGADRDGFWSGESALQHRDGWGISCLPNGLVCS